MNDPDLFREGEWELVGNFGVDAGLVYIGDPCYLSSDVDEVDRNPFRDWGKFVDKLHSDVDHLLPCGIDFNDNISPNGHKGVLSDTGYGDGLYPVWARKDKDGCILELRIFFDGTDPFSSHRELDEKEWNQEEV